MQSDTDAGSFCFQLLGFQSTTWKEMEEANAKKKKNSFVYKRHEKKVCIINLFKTFIKLFRVIFF